MGLTPNIASGAKGAGKRRPAQANARKNANDRKAGAKKARKSSANTSNFHYFSRRNLPKECRDDKARIHKECDTDEGREKSKTSLKDAKLDANNKPSGAMSRMQGVLKKGVTAIDGVGKLKSGYKSNSSNEWMEQHCSGLWNKSGGKKDGELNNEAFKREIEGKVGEMTKTFESLEQQALDKIRSFAGDYMKDHAKDTLGAAAEKAAKRAAASRFPALMSLVGRFSMWEGVGQLLGNVAGAVATDDMARKFEALEKQLAEYSQKLQEYKNLLSKGGLQDAMASTQAAIAMANPCIKARKCLLVPYDEADKTENGKGCCPGQTGHHVMPDAMFKKYVAGTDPNGKPTMTQGGKRDCWDKYSHGKAPTMCLEGTTNRPTNGSHGLAHAGTAEALEGDLGKQDMDYTKARNKISEMIAKPFGCNPECIKKQLDDVYKKMYTCKDGLENAKVTPHSGESGGGPVIIEQPNGM